jgi:hypothetical protein
MPAHTPTRRSRRSRRASRSGAGRRRRWWASGRVLGKSVGQDASGGPGTDDHIIRLHLRSLTKAVVAPVLPSAIGRRGCDSTSDRGCPAIPRVSRYLLVVKTQKARREGALSALSCCLRGLRNQTYGRGSDEDPRVFGVRDMAVPIGDAPASNSTPSRSPSSACAAAAPQRIPPQTSPRRPLERLLGVSPSPTGIRSCEGARREPQAL